MREFRRIAVATLGLALAGSALGAVQFFNSSSPANNAATRGAWLAAAGINAPTYFEDFESSSLLNVNISGQAGLLAGGLMITDTSVGSAVVRDSSAFFGSSNPVGTQSLAHNERPYLQLDFGPFGVDYIGGLDIDETNVLIIVTYVGGGTTSHNLSDGTGASGNSAEFWGFYRNDMPRITRIQMDASGDGQWGIDNLEFSASPVPEPGTIALGVLALAAGARRRAKRNR